jgi:hypothetical protein
MHHTPPLDLPLDALDDPKGGGLELEEESPPAEPDVRLASATLNTPTTCVRYGR